MKTLGMAEWHGSRKSQFANCKSLRLPFTIVNLQTQPRMNEPQNHITCDYYDQVRHQIEHEDDLITQRISWLMASQSFLFSAYAIVLNGLKSGEKTPLESVKLNFYHFLPVAGMLSTAL